MARQPGIPCPYVGQTNLHYKRVGLDWPAGVCEVACECNRAKECDWGHDWQDAVVDEADWFGDDEKEE